MTLREQVVALDHVQLAKPDYELVNVRRLDTDDSAGNRIELIQQ